MKIEVIVKIDVIVKIEHRAFKDELGGTAKFSFVYFTEIRFE